MSRIWHRHFWKYPKKKIFDWLFQVGNSQWHQPVALMSAFTMNLISQSWYGRLMTLSLVSTFPSMYFLGGKCYNGIPDGEWLKMLMKCGTTSKRDYFFSIKEVNIDWKLWNKMGENYLVISETKNLKVLDGNCKDLW
jgi:hypothetical protein